MSPMLSPEQFFWMEVFLFPGRGKTILPVIMWWNGMMPPAGRTVLWTGQEWPLQTISPLLSQVCQPIFPLRTVFYCNLVFYLASYLCYVHR